MIREQNEDSYLVLAAPALSSELDALLVVADGVGGRQAGSAASNEVVQALQDLFSSPLYQEQVGYSLDREDYYVVVLKEVLEQINEHLYNLATSQPALHGMGTTASVALLADDHLYVGHVGDSRIYLMRDGRLQQLTHDDSWVAEQVQAGALTWEQAASHPQRNVITSCLGNSLVLRVERAVFPARPGDQILLCTDGLINLVRDEELGEVLAAHPNPQATCDHLVQVANQRGGSDNITVVLLQLAEGTGNNLPGGRARGPQQTDPLPQVDTIKLTKAKTGTGLQSRWGRGRRDKSERIQAVLTLMLSTIACLAVTLLGTEALAMVPVSAMPWFRFLIVLLATVLGFAAGYVARVFAVMRIAPKSPGEER
jgi:protein phosphatase